MEEIPRKGYSTEENRAFYRGRKYERRRNLKIVLWCIAGLIIVAEVINLLEGHVLIVSLR